MTESFLERVTAARRADARARTAAGALDEAKAGAERARPARDLAEALAAPGLSVIAEVKRASPTAGRIAGDVDPVAIARAYEAGGAAAVSVLTEPDHFGGSLEDLRAVAAAVSIPVLRKDFVCEPLHVWEARAAAADSILLIVAALSEEELGSLHALAVTLGMMPLVEVHTVEEVAPALAVGARIIGINTRDLATLAVDPSMVAAVRPAIPSGVVVVGESGIAARADVRALEEVPVDAILVGEALMRAPDPGRAVGALLGR